MSRPLRIEFEGAFYHVMARGNARQDIFLDEADRAGFLDNLGRVVQRFGWQVWAWCLMSNHYHLLVETPEPNLSKWSARIGQRSRWTKLPVGILVAMLRSAKHTQAELTRLRRLPAILACTDPRPVVLLER